jgi:hypothetical protein
LIDGMAPTTSSDVYFDAMVPASLQHSIGAEVGTPLVMSCLWFARTSSPPTASGVRQYLYLQIQPKTLISKMPGFFFSWNAPRHDPAPGYLAHARMLAAMCNAQKCRDAHWQAAPKCTRKPRVLDT